MKFLFLFLIFIFEASAVEKIQPIVYVSCSPKSGSQTLTESFKAIGFETIFSHGLSPESCNEILEKSKKQPILLIDSTRDIIAKRISGFFQHHLVDLVGMGMDQIVENYEKDKVGYLNFLMSEFNKMIIPIGQQHASESWIYLGYDYLKDGYFNFKKKYQIKRIGNLYFVNLRFDDIEQWESIIKSLPIPFKLKKFKIINSNQTKDKIHKDLYSDFFRNVRISRSDFNEIIRININHLEHFYTNQEMEDFINRWKPHIVD